MSSSSKFVWGLWLLLAVTPAAAFGQDRWQFGSTPSFSSGKYGTDERTDVIHTPFIARRLFTSGDFAFVFPFTCVSGNGFVAVIDGTPVGNTQRQAAAGPSARTVRGAAAASTPSTPPVNVCGIGDIVVRGRYYLLDERGWMPTVALRAHLKVPTASVERGLGTGRPDEGVGIEVSRTIAPSTLMMVDGGYTFIGKPDDVTYNNTWWYDIGVGYDLPGSNVNLSVFYEEDRTILPGFPNARDILAAVMLKGRSGWRFQAATQFGLSDGAPALGITLGASRRF